jgi:hypothetical protein
VIISFSSTRPIDLAVFKIKINDPNTTGYHWVQYSKKSEPNPHHQTYYLNPPFLWFIKTVLNKNVIIIIIYLLQLGLHPVAVVLTLHNYNKKHTLTTTKNIQ